MIKYVGKRLLSAVVTLAVILTIVFILLRQMPIEGYLDNIDKMDDAMIAAKLAQLGLDQPMHIQLLRFFNSLLHGDLGVSSRYRAGAPIIDIISQKAPLSIELGVMAMGVAMLLGLPLGMAMARSKGKFWDKFGTVFIVLINAVPAAVYYIYLQSYGTRALQIGMLFDRTNWKTWILPVFSMSLGNIAYYAKIIKGYIH